MKQLCASAQVTVINHVVVSVQPASVTLAPLAVQGFTASVLGTGNQSVAWQVQGVACSIGGVCGTIDPSGTYTAPGAPPAPDAIQAVAISSDDTSQFVVAPNVSDEVIALTSSAPTAVGKDIVVVDPTMAGVSMPGNDVDLDVRIH